MDQLATTTLRAVLAEVADLGPSPEIAYAQTELARALMLAGLSEESIEWCDRVLAHPLVASPDVMLEALITKGTSLTIAGRFVESEALLRGGIAIADADQNIPAALRGRNNLRVLLQWKDLPEALAQMIEVRSIAQKFGVRAWVLHGTAASMDVTFRMGDWDRIASEDMEQLLEGGDFYASWYRIEAGRRAIYRGDPAVAQRGFEAGLETQAVTGSAQAMTWTHAARADALIPQGRFDEAFESAMRGRGLSSEHELALLAGLFAAAAAADAGRIRQVQGAFLEDRVQQLTAGRGYLAVAESLAAAIEGRWDDARTSMHEAEEALGGMGEAFVVARFRLALGALAGEALPEATEAARQAEEFFLNLGAARYVTAYRKVAKRSPAVTADGRGTSDSARDRAPAVRAAG
jgi:hypothetical protein